MRSGSDPREACLILLVGAALSLATPALAQDCPELVGSVGIQYAVDVAVSGDHAYVAWDEFSGGRSGLRVFDVSDPYYPVVVGVVDLDWSSPRAVAVSGNYVYVADSHSRILRVIDVSEPTAPVQVGFIGELGAGYPQDVAVSSDYAYVVNWNTFYGSFNVIDVSEPTAPIPVACLDGSHRGVAVSGGYAYVVIPGSFEVIDVSDPWAPVQVGVLYPHAGGYGVAVSGGYAYVASPYSPGVYVIDVSESTAPVEVGFLDTPISAWDVAVSRGYAYVVVGEGLYVIDVSTPSAPVEVGYRDAGQADDTVGGIAVSDGYVFLANGGGLFIFRECGPLFSDGFESGDTSAWSATVP